jgi:hypothetical protein
MLVLLIACNKDDRERLFEMTFPAIDFEIPAGLSPTLPRVFERDDQLTNIGFFLTENNLTEAQIDGILPAFARITALDNLDYEFVQEVSVRICDAGSLQCTMADEVFYIDNLQGRAGDVIDLLPSLRNAKRHLIKENFKLEVVFFLRYSSPYSVRSRLDMRFDAVKN